MVKARQLIEYFYSRSHAHCNLFLLALRYQLPAAPLFVSSPRRSKAEATPPRTDWHNGHSNQQPNGELLRPQRINRGRALLQHVHTCAFTALQISIKTGPATHRRKPTSFPTHVPREPVRAHAAPLCASLLTHLPTKRGSELALKKDIHASSSRAKRARRVQAIYPTLLHMLVCTVQNAVFGVV
jgi:hypothetical protein